MKTEMSKSASKNVLTKANSASHNSENEDMDPLAKFPMFFIQIASSKHEQPRIVTFNAKNESVDLSYSNPATRII